MYYLIMLNTFRKLVLSLLVLNNASPLFCQRDSAIVIQLDTVSVTETRPSFSTTSKDVITITNQDIKEKGSQSLSDALATLPGVNQLTTGAISKPVIRGLYGNRILINMAGIPLEDQEWEDEHGLGISDIGIERVELVKGPASLMFGPGAMGGVINILAEDMPAAGKREQEINLGLFSGSYGAQLDYGFRQTRKNSFLARAGFGSHADYSDGSGERVPNTRFDTWDLNLGYVMRRKRWISDNRLITFFNRFGFISDSTDIIEAADDPRLSHRLDLAHSSILFTLLSSVNSLSLNDRTDVNILIGLQNNWRQEQERGNRVDLNLLLNTATFNSYITRKLTGDWIWTNGISGKFQKNTNLGSRIIVPDASVLEASAYSYVSKRHMLGSFTGNFETGIRYDHIRISTVTTGSFNTQDGMIPPFNRNFNILNGSAGETLILQNLVLKLDIGTGFRPGNLAELAADGLHEGTPNWYIGDPYLDAEQCLNTGFSVNWLAGFIRLSGSVFRNRFYNYIYLLPVDEEYFGFDVFRYVQSKATLQGLETGIAFDNNGSLKFSLSYSFLDAHTDDGEWLPFMPANRLRFDSKYFMPGGNAGSRHPYLSIGALFCEPHNHTAASEDPTPRYLLLNAGAGITLGQVRLMLMCRNLTGRLYYDHLSRLKYFGMYDEGRTFVLNMSWDF